MVALFGLPRIIKYKKGNLIERREGLAQLRSYLRRLSGWEPRVISTALFDDLLSRDIGTFSGRQLKDYEDSLDAFFCAYLGFYFWYWQWARNEAFGDIRSGYILNPRLRVTQA